MKEEKATPATPPEPPPQPAPLQPIVGITTLPRRGSTTIHVVPARPCALVGCTGELHVQLGVDSMRLHLDDEQRRSLIVALGGTVAP